MAHTLSKLMELVAKIFAIFNGIVLICVSILTGIDVTLSAFFGAPIPATIEITVLVLPWVVCGGLAYALVTKMHVRVTLFVDRMKPNMKKLNMLITNFAGFAFCVALTIGGWLHFWSSWIIDEPMFAALMTLPAWLGKLAVPVGFFLLGLDFLLRLFSSNREI